METRESRWGVGAAALIAAALIAARLPTPSPASRPASSSETGDAEDADAFTGKKISATANRRTVGQAAWLPAGVLVALLGFGVQVHTFMHSEALYRTAGATLPMLWLPAFWLGFALLCLFADSQLKARDPVAFLPLAAAAGTLALLLARQAPPLPAALQCAAGAAWALFLQALFARAARMAHAPSPSAGAGSATGVLFSAMAVAAAARLAVVAGGGNPRSSARMGAGRRMDLRRPGAGPAAGDASLARPAGRAVARLSAGARDSTRPRLQVRDAG